MAASFPSPVLWAGGGGAALIQHPRVNLLKGKAEPQIRPGAEGLEFGALNLGSCNELINLLWSVLLLGKH